MAVNPVVGVSTLLAQLFLRNPVMKSLSFEYKVTGPWSDPIVVKQGQVTPVDAQRAKEVLDKGKDGSGGNGSNGGNQAVPAAPVPAPPASRRPASEIGPAVNSGA
jgi:hypothetical protein